MVGLYPLFIDPHEANLLVRPNPLNPSKPQLVLLDHGLYRELKDDFRRDYCYLWREIICGNKEGIHEYATRMNVGELFTLLAAMLTMKSWDDIISKDLKKMKLTNHSSENVQLQAYAERYLDQINYILGKVPSDMLLLLKTNDCLRHIDRRLNTPINTISGTNRWLTIFTVGLLLLLGFHCQYYFLFFSF